MDTTRIYTIGGTVQAGGGRYIVRRADDDLLALCRERAFAYILSARQLGKSSLLLHTAERLADEGIRSVLIDLTLIGTQVTAEGWYFGLLDEMAAQLRLTTDVLAWWEARAALGLTQRFSRFCEEVLLGEVAGPVVVFVDEIDTTLALDFADDFFAAIRGLYLARARRPDLRRLSFVLSGVATPGDLVRDPQRTPFNIGQRVEMTDFTPEEAAPLADGLGLPAGEAHQVLGWVLAWTGGHPYLTQQLCGMIAARARCAWTAAAVGDLARTTFGVGHGEPDHNVQFVRDMLTKRAADPEAVLTTFRAVRRARPPVPDEEQSLVKAHLKLSGVVRRERGTLRVRNRVYRTIFDEHWIGEHLPVNWARRLRRAARVIAVLLALSMSLSGLAIYALVQQREAQAQSQLAFARELAANALVQGQADPELGLLLALAGEQVVSTEQGEAALRQLLADVSLRSVLTGHAGAVRAVAFAPAAGLLVTGGADGTTRLWETDTGTTRAVLRGHVGSVTSLAVSGDGTVLVTGGDDGTAILWDVGAARQRTTLRGHAASITGVAITPDGARVVTTSADATARLWEAVSGAPVATLNGHAGSVLGAAISPDGRHLATFSEDGNARLWAADGGALVAELADHLSLVTDAVFSPDGRRLATASHDGTVRLWEADTGRSIAMLTGHADRVVGVAFSPDGRRLVSASHDRTARLWETASGQVLAVLRHDGPVTRVAFSPDGLQVATAGADGTARLWESASGQRLVRLDRHGGAVTALAYPPDGRLLATGGADGLVRVWEVDGAGDAAPLVVHAEAFTGAALSPDGRLILTTGVDDAVRLWDRRTGRLLATMMRDCFCTVQTAAFSPDSRWVVLTTEDGGTELWEVESRQRRAQLERHAGPVIGVAFSADTRYLATASADGTVRVWSMVPTAVPAAVPLATLHGHGGPVLAVAFSGDGERVITASADGSLRWWATRSGWPLSTPSSDLGAVRAARFNADGAWLAAGDAGGEVQVWEVGTSNARVVARVAGVANGLAMSPDGRLLVVVDAEGVVRIAETAAGAPVGVVRERAGPARSATISLDGRWLVVVGGDRAVRLYPWGRFAPLDSLLAEARRRVTRDLTCAEQQQFLHRMVCAPTPGVP
jgi:WD40 repeat protein